MGYIIAYFLFVVILVILGGGAFLYWKFGGATTKIPVPTAPAPAPVPSEDVDILARRVAGGHHASPMNGALVNSRSMTITRTEKGIQIDESDFSGTYGAAGGLGPHVRMPDPILVHRTVVPIAPLTPTVPVAPVKAAASPGTTGGSGSPKKAKPDPAPSAGG